MESEGSSAVWANVRTWDREEREERERPYISIPPPCPQLGGSFCSFFFGFAAFCSSSGAGVVFGLSCCGLGARSG